MKSVYAFIHYAFGGVKAPSISVLGSPLRPRGRLGVFRRREGPSSRPVSGHPLLARLAVLCSSYEATPHAEVGRQRTHFSPGSALSSSSWVFLLRPVRLSARSMGSGADGRAFPVCGRLRLLPSLPVRLLFLVLLPRSPCVPGRSDVFPDCGRVYREVHFSVLLLFSCLRVRGSHVIAH